MAENGDDDLHFVPVAFREQRADRTVDQAGDQRLTLRGTALPLEIAAGNTAGREGLFLIVDGEREEVLTGLGVFGADDGGEHGRIAPGRHHGAVGLAGDLAGFEHELAAGPVEFFTMDFEH